MMYFRYKIKNGVWNCYTLHIQYKFDTCDEWKKFERVSLFDVCCKIADDYILFAPSFNDQLERVGHCIEQYGSMRMIVTKYILSVLKVKDESMTKQDVIKKTKQMLDGLADNTWSDVIVINEDEINKETTDE